MHLRVLNDVSLEVNSGEIVALVGANGAGKTSLVSVIGGNLKPSLALLFNEIELTNKPPHLRSELGIGVVPEGRRLFPKMTVEENLLLGGINRRAVRYGQKKSNRFF